MLKIFNVNGNTITGVCSQIQESVYRTLIEACQVPGVLKWLVEWHVPSPFFFLLNFLASFPLSARLEQAASQHVPQHEKVPN